MKSFEEAIAIISGLAVSFGEEYIDLENAEGRILAENIYADRDYPPFNRAAMDGYAIIQDDWNEGIRQYKIIETIYAGKPSKRSLNPGSCYKIMTGAACPSSANVIIKREDAEEFKNNVIFKNEVIRPYQNIALKGEDTKECALLLSAPCKCNAQIISLLAAVGKTRIRVCKLPEVALITTGDEVINPGLPVDNFQIRNSNQYLLKGLLKKWNITPWLCKHASDHKIKLTKILKEAIQSDITIINGGVSAGDADYVPGILKTLGVEIIFHKVKVRPGKPLWLGKTPSGGLVFALPGNPLSCLTTFTLFVEEYLYKCFNYSQRPLYQLPILDYKLKKYPYDEFFPVSVNSTTPGLNLVPFNGSGDITAGISAGGIAMQPNLSTQLNPGDLIRFYPFTNL